MINWNPYLESICHKYDEWWKVYTLTDVEGRQQVETDRSSLLLGLKVQTVLPNKQIERLGVLEGLRKYVKEHVLLVGRPGSGKSTALARLLLEEAEKSRGAEEQGSRGAEERQIKIPVLVELRYYETSVLDLIRDFLKRHRLLLNIAVIEQLLFDGRLLLLVDGINELRSDDARGKLKKFREDYSATPMIFTTRDLGVGGDLDIAKKLEMQPLTDPQMRDFVNSYLPEQGDRMLQHLGDRLREFGQTPLLLMMLCSLFAITDDVPHNLGLVFRLFTQVDYDRQRLQDVPVTDESQRWWKLLLKHLAFRMTQGSEPTELRVAIPREEAEKILKEFLQQEKFDKPRDRAMEWLKDCSNIT
ncbi:MAG: hypothetical protein HC773_04560 [Scytonema sp. CRU_2_7]|nr:hypothetical protein [Scytonema sp. CRU_2_7]